MSTPLVVFDNPAQAAIELLQPKIATRSEVFAANVTFSHHRPKSGHTAPVVQVAVDGDTPTYPIASDVLLRVTVWHTREDYAYDLAQLCQGLLATGHKGALVGSRLITGPLSDIDSMTGDPFATFMLRVWIRSKSI